MTASQLQLYRREWAAAARALSWNTKAGRDAAFVGWRAGQVWQSPQLNQKLAAIYSVACTMAAGDSTATADHLRHACTVAAIGRSKSSLDFTNAEFDQVLALLRLLADPTNLTNLIAADNAAASGERRRHVHVINQADAPYWQRIACDRFGHCDLDRLSITQLRQLSLTLRNRCERLASVDLATR